VRDAITDEDRWWEEAASADWWAHEYGWTPDEVDALPIRVKDRLPGVARMRHELKAKREREANR